MGQTYLKSIFSGIFYPYPCVFYVYPRCILKVFPDHLHKERVLTLLTCRYLSTQTKEKASLSDKARQMQPLRDTLGTSHEPTPDATSHQPRNQAPARQTNDRNRWPRTLSFSLAASG